MNYTLVAIGLGKSSIVLAVAVKAAIDAMDSAFAEGRDASC
jgi:hypothetical protein